MLRADEGSAPGHPEPAPSWGRVPAGKVLSSVRARLGQGRLLPAWRPVPLSGRLILLASVALLPVVLLAVAALVLLSRQQSTNLEHANLETTRALIGSVDSELNRSIAVLETLAAADTLDRNDLEAFYDGAVRVLRERPSWTTIVLSDPSGQQLLDLERPFGSPLSSVVIERGSFDAVLRTRRPVVGSMRRGPAAAMAAFPVRVPVIRGGSLRYVLTAVVKPEAMLEVIQRQNVPPDGLVTIFDANGTIVARSRAQSQYVGQPVSQGFREFTRRGREGWGVTPTVDGRRVYAAYSLSQSSGWGVGLGIPGEVIDAPVRWSYVYLGAGVLLSLALGVSASTFVARRITRPIDALRSAALAVGRGERPARVSTDIPEVRDVAEALHLAAESRQLAELTREEVLRLERHGRTTAEHANRLKDEFLAMLGHELRNPLAAMGSAIQVLEQQAPSDPAMRRAHEILRRQVEHLVRLVDDLLDVERVMTGKIVLERSPLELSEAVRQSLSTLQSAGRLERHEVSLEAEEVWIDGDATRIDQIVVNLITNAVKYTPAAARVAVTVAPDAGEAVLRVRDEGIGLEPDLLPRVFDLFVQGERALDRAQGGLGVGLTLVRRLAELHGGSVQAESEGPGKGSAFTVRLPAIARPATASKPAPAVPAAARRRVLVIEDHDDARAMMRLLLEGAGHVVHEAADGPSGVQAALRLRPDVALIDLGLPELDGYEVARRIRAGAQGVRLVALTGYGLPQDRQRAKEAGFDRHLVKPVELETIERVLAELA